MLGRPRRTVPGPAPFLQAVPELRPAPSAVPDERRVLFFEPETGGHHFDYVRHLVSLRSGCEGPRVAFALGRELAEEVERAPWWKRRPQASRVSILTLDEAEETACRAGPLWRRGFARWRSMSRCLEQTGASDGVFLHLDHLQLALAARLRVPEGVRLSGILFRPSVHYASLGCGSGSLRERARDRRKRWTYAAMLRHPSLHRVFSFDPYFSDFARTSLPCGEKVCTIPDPATLPVFPSRPLPSPIPTPPPGRVRFLLFGSLARRKGILQVLDAVARLSPAAAARVAVTFAGRLDPEVRSAFRARLDELASERKEAWIHLEDRFLEERELVSLVQRCDAVLAPYQRFVGSSGVLVWAAGAGKPVITQDYGLLGFVVARHELGHRVDTTDPGAIAAAIDRCVRGDLWDAADRERMARFAHGQDAQEFARRLLELR